MPPIDERVSYLEGRVEDQAAAIGELRTDIREVRTELRDVRTEVRDLRAEMIRRFEQVDGRFNWLLGLQFATLLAVISALLNTAFR